ncbi:carboxymuconolactone decarboxylase family protein [Streptomyces sp. NPDC001380]|uniref:carboxymuconolactone decarboxylase family protein n=1 Tax=Streptomyces sp. NPDC001380 TaxID=3364566 RepID=UPI00367403B3
MSRIARHTVQDAPEAGREALAGLAFPNGRLLNIFGHMAASPAVLHGYLGLRSAIAEHGTLDGRTQEAIALAVAAENACDYCQAAHTAGGTQAGLTREETVAIRRGDTAFDPRLGALLAVARQAAAKVGVVDDAAWEAARAAGWTDEQLAELHVHIAINLYTNHFNHWAATELDLPAAPAL